MNQENMMRNDRFGWSVLLFTGFSLCTALIVGCGKAAPTEPAVSTGQPVLNVESQSSQFAGRPAADQPLYNSDQEAVDALVQALQASDNRQTVHRVLGVAEQDISSGDPVADAKGFEKFSARMKEKTRLEKQSDDKAILHLGEGDWPFPFPIVKGADGKWFFDGVTGKTEILARRIGANELMAIKVCRAYVDAQREYASKYRDNSDVLKYAQRFRSNEGKQDGLYWKTQDAQEESPFGETIAQAGREGYDWGQKGAIHMPYHGYLFRILRKQGPAAPGGKYDYVINGNMIAGFALVAYPDKYGASGIMTFIVNHQGKVYQKDLGAGTVEAASKMNEYNPDGSWTLQQ
jgi:hypothetical protein